MKLRYLFLLLALSRSGAGLAGDSGQIMAATELKREPYSDAQNSGNLTAGSQVDVLKRQGGWLQVKSSAGEGWVRMLSVKLSATAPATGGDTGVKELVNVAQTGRSGNSGMTVATGIRGLSAEELKNPTPNPEAVKKLDSFVVSKSEAEKFAGRENLASKPIDYLQPGKPAIPSPAATPASQPPAGGTPLFGGLGK